MRKGFTLVEMLVVVVVLVTLMGMVFRLGSLGNESRARNLTISRLQRLENCLSGYYAAFGTYPPVKLHGSRNPYRPVSAHGIQDPDGADNRSIFNWDVAKFRRGTFDDVEDKAWRQVEAACKSQPVDCQFPFPDGYNEFVEANAEVLQSEIADGSLSVSADRKRVFTQGFDDGVSKNIGRFGPYQDKTEWEDLQLFRFGLMSYLLPRYIVMMQADRSLYEDYAQWTQHNKLPCDPLTGIPFDNWGQVRNKAASDRSTDLAHVANIPSQAACARWIPNLESAVFTPHSLTVFGVKLHDDCTGFSAETPVYSPGGFKNDSTANQYTLDFCTVRDGWQHEFFYYSPSPHQSYVLWSGGPNGRTFPPWISRSDLGASENEHIGAWIEDDIVNMSH